MPCIILKPTIKRKLARIKVDTLGSFITLRILVKIPLNFFKGVPVEIVLDSNGRLSGSLVIANEREINERILENIHGNK